jgi:hypothetical protein
MTLLCEFCNSTFTTKKGLLTHQRNAKYCLEKQGNEAKQFSCECGKQYTLRSSLQRHKEGCIMDPEIKQRMLLAKAENEILHMVIGKYEKLVENTVNNNNNNTPTTTNNNSNNNRVMNLRPITDEALKEHLDQLSLTHIQSGAKGYADYAKHHQLFNKVICTDKARKKLRYKDADGSLSDDSIKLAQRFFHAIDERNTAILTAAYTELHHQLNEIIAENRAGDADVTSILTEATDLQTTLLKTQRAARGEEEEFAREFLNHLAKIL